MSALSDNAITRLVTVSSIDMNTAVPTLLYTIPTGKSLVVTQIIIRNASASLATASLSFGYNSAAYNDLFPNAAHTSVTTSLKYKSITQDAGTAPVIGLSNQGLFVKMNTLQAASTTMEVFGYLF